MMLKTHSKRAYFHIFPTRNECKFFPDRKLVPLATLLLQGTSLETLTAWSKGLVSRFRGERRFSKGMISFTKDELDQKRRRNLTVVLDYYDAKEPYSRIGLLRSYGTLQSYWTTTKLSKLTVVLDYYEAKETYSLIGLPRSYRNLQSYWTTAKLSKLTVVLDYHEAIETYSRIGLPRS